MNKPVGDFVTYGSEKFQYAHLNSLVSFSCRDVILSDRSIKVLSENEHDYNM